MTLSNALSSLFGDKGHLGTIPFGAPDITGAVHNGVDWIVSAGTQIKAVVAGTVVVSEGDQVGIQSASGTIESYLHIIPGLAVGQTVTAGQVIGTVDSQTGQPYYVNGDRYWSDTPHVHFALVSTIQQALSDTGGIDPTAFLESAAGGSGGGSTPVIGGIGDGLGWLGHRIDTLAGGNQPDLTKIPSAIQDPGGAAKATIGAGFGTIGDWLGSDSLHTIRKYLVLALIAVAGLIVLAELMRPGTTVDVAAAATK